jgi:hypothetical protein
MAKVRLDWFKLDCQLDSKFRLIESEFGLKGFAIVVKLFQMIYGGEGYYCDWDEDIVLVFAKDNDVSAGTVSEIVSRAISRGIFDKGMFEKYGILTSHGIQTRYSEAVGRRKFSNIKSEYDNLYIDIRESTGRIQNLTGSNLEIIRGCREIIKEIRDSMQSFEDNVGDINTCGSDSRRDNSIQPDEVTQ